MGAMVVSAVVFVVKNGNATVDMVLDYTPENKWLAAAVMLVLFALKSQTVVIPYAVLATAAGLMFELPAAILVNLLGSCVCISVPFFVGYASKGALLEKTLQKSAKLKEAYELNRGSTFESALILRALNLSNDLLGVLFGSVRAPYGSYLSASLIGILPSMLLYTVIGSEESLISVPSVIMGVSDLLLIISAALIMKRKRRMNNKTP